MIEFSVCYWFMIEFSVCYSPVQAVPVHASSSIPSPEHSTVSQVRLLAFFPVVIDQALQGVHTP